MKIIKANEPVKITGIKMLIYGQPGIGKTTFSISGEKTLLIDCDGGLRRVSPFLRSDYVDVQSWQDIIEVVTDVQVKAYKTIVIDTVGKCLDYLTEKIIRDDYKQGNKNGGLTMAGYGTLKSMFSDFLKKIAISGLNVVFVAHEKEEKDGDNRMVRPDIIGGSLGNVMREMDLVGYMESKNNKRTISFNPTDKFHAKNTCNLPDVIEIPNITTKELQPVTEIFSKFTEQEAEHIQIVEKYNTLMDVISSKLEEITIENIADVVTEINNLESIWGSRIQARNMIIARMQELGIAYNAKTRVYEKN